MGHSEAMQRRLIQERMLRAQRGSVAAYYELGVDYSVGRHGLEVDLVAAHKWFNLAALKGRTDAIAHRREVAEQMSDVEIAAAQREARAWMTTH